MKPDILLLDDSTIFLMQMAKALEDYYVIHTAEKAGDALEILTQTHIDLILADVEMPGMDGFAFADLLRYHPKYSAIPLIFVTAHGTREFVEYAVSKGAKHFIVKPCKPEYIRERVDGVLHLSQNGPERPPEYLLMLRKVRELIENSNMVDAFSFVLDLQCSGKAPEDDAALASLEQALLAVDYRAALKLVDNMIAGRA